MAKFGLRTVLMFACIALVAAVAALYFGVPWIRNIWLTMHDPHPNAAAEYQGAGTFYDAGPSAELHRFVLDLGKIDLSKSGTYEFSLGRLPYVNFYPHIVVNYPLVYMLEDRPQSPWAQATVTIWLNSEDAKEEFRVSAPLREQEWVWAGLVGGSWSELYSLKTRFAPLPTRVYRLGVEVAGGGAPAPVARLQVCGGGSHEEPPPPFDGTR